MRKSVGEIIETIKSLKGLTKEYEVADLLGISRGALSNAKRRDSISFLDNLISFCHREELTLDIIRQEPSSCSGLAHNTRSQNEIPYFSDYNYTEIPVYSLDGDLSYELKSLDIVDRTLISRELLRDGYIAARVKGDSMEKLFMDGTNILIDTRMKDILSGSVYVLNIPRAGITIRECYLEPVGLSLRPYNKNYPCSSIKWHDFEPEMVIGKVTCSFVNVFG